MSAFREHVDVAASHSTILPIVFIILGVFILFKISAWGFNYFLYVYVKTHSAKNSKHSKKKKKKKAKDSSDEEEESDYYEID